MMASFPCRKVHVICLLTITSRYSCQKLESPCLGYDPRIAPLLGFSQWKELSTALSTYKALLGDKCGRLHQPYMRETCVHGGKKMYYTLRGAFSVCQYSKKGGSASRDAIARAGQVSLTRARCSRNAGACLWLENTSPRNLPPGMQDTCARDIKPPSAPRRSSVYFIPSSADVL